MYKCKVILVSDSEWQPPTTNPGSAAGPDIEGAWLARRVTVQVWNADADGNLLSLLETRDFLIPEPYSTQTLADAINAYKSTLPERNEDEGLVFD